MVKRADIKKKRTKSNILNTQCLLEHEKNNYLITHELYSNRYFDYGYTVLEVACFGGKQNVLRKLIYKLNENTKKYLPKTFDKKNAVVDYINTQDKNKETACHISINRGNIDCLIELLKNGAKISIKNKFGCYPMALLQKISHLKTFKLEIGHLLGNHNVNLYDKDREIIGDFLNQYFPHASLDTNKYLKASLTYPSDNIQKNGANGDFKQYIKMTKLLINEEILIEEEKQRVESQNQLSFNKLDNCMENKQDTVDRSNHPTAIFGVKESTNQMNFPEKSQSLEYETFGQQSVTVEGASQNLLLLFSS